MNQTTVLKWEKLSPHEFDQLQNLISYSTRKLQDTLIEFCGPGPDYRHHPDSEINFDSFREFIDLFLEVKMPEELCRHVFLSFARTYTDGQFEDKPSLKEVATITSATALAPVAARNEFITFQNLEDFPFNWNFDNASASLQLTSNSKNSISPSRKYHRLFSIDKKSKKHGSVNIDIDINLITVSLKDIVCYLSLLEAGTPEDKLEFMFRLYDSDGNGVLDTREIDCIVNQMMSVAEYLGWDVTELKPILQEMMIEIDYDSDGTVSLKEWKQGGMTTIPLLVLLGFDSNARDDGQHFWHLKNFNKPAYCNLCLNILVGLGKKGLSCIFCKFTVHERCVQRATANCISTYMKSKKNNLNTVMMHHWVEGNCNEKCAKCRKRVKSYHSINGLHCRWCQITLHNKCASQVKPECDLGDYYVHILPPIAIFPIVLNRQTSKTSIPISNSQANKQPAMSFQITPLPNTIPLLVFINPKSGGRQGERMLRKFQYILNPRQIYNLAKDDPIIAFNMFRDIKNFKVICCGGDGTIGWILDMLDKVQLEVKPALGIVPLGTGNDLARCLQWGSGYEGESIHKILNNINNASVVMMDRWQMSLMQSDEIGNKSHASKSHTSLDRKWSLSSNDQIPYTIINNYFSIGVDAAICVKFHWERERNPEKFNSRMKNKLWYFEYATSEQFSASCKNLHDFLDITCDDITIDLRKSSPLQGIALLNIPYTHGGSNLWGQKNPAFIYYGNTQCGRARYTADLNAATQHIGDGLIEVIGLESCLHLGTVRTGLRASGRRLAQCSKVVIHTHKTFPMQIDGEPWMQSPCSIEIVHKNQVPMLMGPSVEKKKWLLRCLK